MNIKIMLSRIFKISLSFILAIFCAIPLGLNMTGTEAAAEESTQEKLDNAQAKLDEVNKKLTELQAEFSEVNENLVATTKEVESVNSQIAEQQAKLEAKQLELGDRISSKYRGGETTILDLVLNSTSFSDFANNWFLANKVMQSDNQLIAEVKDTKEQLANQKSELEKLQAQQQQDIQRVQAKQQETTELINNLDSEVKQLMEQRDAELVAAARAAEAARSAQSSSSGGGSTYQGSAQIPHADTSKGQAIVNACFSTPSPGNGYCAMWVSWVYNNAGCGYPSGNANDMYWAYCHSSDKSELQPGMIIATPSHTNGGAWAVIYGHVGIYIGDGLVMHNVGAIVTTPLDQWIQTHSTTYTVKWGWA